MTVFSLSMDDALAGAEVIDGEILDLDTEVFGHDLTTGEGSDILEHGLAAFTEAGSLDGDDIQGATEFC